MSATPTIRGIKACVFDAYGTLFAVHSAVGKHRERLGDIADQVSAVWRTKQPEEIVFQSSNAWDASGAAAFGFKVAWVNRFGQSPERLPGRPTVEIVDLSKLPELIA